MTFVALTLMGVARSIRQDMILVDQMSMIQLPVHREVQLPSPVAQLQTHLPAMCQGLNWATAADCAMSKELLDTIIAQNGGSTGNDMDVAKRVATVQMMVYGSPGAILTAFDFDNSGNLSTEETPKALEAMELPEAGTASIIALVDSNGDNWVTSPELYQFGRACLVIRQFLRDIDDIAPQVDSVDLLPALENNALHIPESTEENVKWHTKFQVLSANLTAECHALTWATEEDCSRARIALNFLVNIATWNSSKTLETAQNFLMMDYLLHLPDYYVFGHMDPDGNRAITHTEFMYDPMLAGKLGGEAGQQLAWNLLDYDGDQNVTREEAYGYVRAGLVIRHFIPDVDPIATGRAKDGTATLVDKTALNMALHIMEPPPVPKAKLAPGPKLLCLIGIMIAAFTIQWFCCAAKPKLDEAEDVKDGKDVK